MKKIAIAILALFLVAASCDIFSSGPGTLGVIKTIDGGATWLPSDKIANNTKNDLSGVSITQMAFQPNNRGIIFMSTVGEGIWKSEDSGVSWTSILSKVTIYDFYVDPQNADNIYAAGIYGNHGKVIHTADGGKTWTEVYNEASVGDAVNSVSANPYNSAELYAGLDSGAIIKSTDSGATWSILKDYQDQVLKIRYNSSNSAIYVLLRDKGLFKSVDSGKTWTDLTTQLTNIVVYSVQTITGNSVGQFQKLGLDDSAPGVIYLTSQNGVYKTANDGGSWQQLNLPIKSGGATPRGIASSKSGMLAYVGIGSTIFKTLDGGQSWQTQSLPSTAEVNTILIDPQLPQISYTGLLSQ